MSASPNEKTATTAAAPQLTVTTAATPTTTTATHNTTTTTTQNTASLEPEKAALSATTTPFDAASLHTTSSSLTKPDPAVRRNSASSIISTPRSYTAGNPFDTDIEAIIPASSQDTCGPTSSNAHLAGTHSGGRKSTNVPRGGDCQVWPGQDHWKKKAKAAKIKNRSSCTCMARLSKRTRVIVKILIVLLIVGIAVGVGFGVSKPLGAPIWGKPNDQKK